MLSLLSMYALSTFPLSKVALSYTSPLFLLALRMTTAGFLLLAYTLLTGIYKQLQKKYIFAYAQAILFASFFPYLLRYYGMQHTSLSGTYLLLQTAPLITYALSCFLSNEKIKTQKIMLLIIAFFCSLLMMGTEFWFANNITTIGFNPASLALLTSIFCFIYGWLIIQKLMTTNNHHPILINMIIMLGGGIVAFLATTCINTSKTITQLQPFLIALIPIILISNLGTYTLYAFLARRHSLTLIALGGHLSPLFTALYQKIFYGTPLALHYLPTGCLLLILLFIFHALETTEKYAANQKAKIVA